MASTNARQSRMDAIIEAIAVEMGIVDPLTGDFTEKHQTGPRTTRITQVRGIPLVNTMGQSDETLRDHFGLDDAGIAEVRRAQAYPYKLTDPAMQAHLDRSLDEREAAAKKAEEERLAAAEEQQRRNIEAMRASGEEAQMARARMGMPSSEVRALIQEEYTTKAGESRRTDYPEGEGPAVAPESASNSEETNPLEAGHAKDTVLLGRNRSTLSESPDETLQQSVQESVRRAGRPRRAPVVSREDFVVEDDE